VLNILVKKNKYEDMEILDLYDKAEISEIFIERLYTTEKTVGVIADRELIAYIMDNVFALEETSVEYLDFSKNLDMEYLIYVDNDGHTTVTPVDEYSILDPVDIVYVDMDGSIGQDTIDYCVNEDKEVILFGDSEEDNCECDGDCENCHMNDEVYLLTSKGDDGNVHGFTASKSDGNSYFSYSYYSTDELEDKDIQSMLKAFGF
jgi:hypothetical protein